MEGLSTVEGCYDSVNSPDNERPWSGSATWSSVAQPRRARRERADRSCRGMLTGSPPTLTQCKRCSRSFVIGERFHWCGCFTSAISPVIRQRVKVVRGLSRAAHVSILTRCRFGFGNRKIVSTVFATESKSVNLEEKSRYERNDEIFPFKNIGFVEIRN